MSSCVVRLGRPEGAEKRGTTMRQRMSAAERECSQRAVRVMRTEQGARTGSGVPSLARSRASLHSGASTQSTASSAHNTQHRARVLRAMRQNGRHSRTAQSAGERTATTGWCAAADTVRTQRCKSQQPRPRCHRPRTHAPRVRARDGELELVEGRNVARHAVTCFVAQRAQALQRVVHEQRRHVHGLEGAEGVGGGRQSAQCVAARGAAAAGGTARQSSICEGRASEPGGSCQRPPNRCAGL